MGELSFADPEGKFKTAYLFQVTETTRNLGL